MRTLLLALFARRVECRPRFSRQPSAELDFVANRVPQLDANFFFQLDPARYRQAAAHIAANMGTLSDAGFDVQLAALIAMAGDPHTAIYLNGSAAAAAGFRQFPLIFRKRWRPTVPRAAPGEFVGRADTGQPCSEPTSRAGGHPGILGAGCGRAADDRTSRSASGAIRLGGGLRRGRERGANGGSRVALADRGCVRRVAAGTKSVAARDFRYWFSSR